MEKTCLSIAEIAEACDIRSSAKNGFNLGYNTPISYFGMAMMGEGGELCNLLAKLERMKMGSIDAGNSITVAGITTEKLAEEIGGLFIYLSILSTRLGIDMERAVVKTFNDKSAKIGYPVFLGNRRKTLIPFDEDKNDVRMAECNCFMCQRKRRELEERINDPESLDHTIRSHEDITGGKETRHYHKENDTHYGSEPGELHD